MCTTKFNLLTYNTHLFFSGLPVSVGPLFKDGERKTAIDQTYLELIQPYSKSGIIQIAALQEVWDTRLAYDIAHDVDSSHHGSFNNRYAAELIGIPGLNPPGLLLLGDPACDFKDEDWHSYKGACGVTGWSGQDDPVMKGYLQVTCDYPCSEYKGKTHAIGLFTTHMPVGYGTYGEQVGCAFDTLANAVTGFLNDSDNTAFAVFLLGDLNIDYYGTTKLSDGNTEYTDTVTDKLINNVGLHDAAADLAAAGNDPGGTILPPQNTLWQYFNETVQPPFPANQRIDYFFYANSPDGNMTVQVDSVTVKTDGLTIEGGYNCSDHYPLQASVTVTVNE